MEQDRNRENTSLKHCGSFAWAAREEGTEACRGHEWIPTSRPLVVQGMRSLMMGSPPPIVALPLRRTPPGSQLVMTKSLVAVRMRPFWRPDAEFEPDGDRD